MQGSAVMMFFTCGYDHAGKLELYNGLEKALGLNVFAVWL
jgi:hypothetical protein